VVERRASGVDIGARRGFGGRCFHEASIEGDVTDVLNRNWRGERRRESEHVNGGLETVTSGPVAYIILLNELLFAYLNAPRECAMFYSSLSLLSKRPTRVA
jgi:hypothetical protein